eukprot:766393-Hanusia_phi.AAC.21
MQHVAVQLSTGFPLTTQELFSFRSAPGQGRERSKIKTRWSFIETLQEGTDDSCKRERLRLRLHGYKHTLASLHPLGSVLGDGSFDMS